MRAGAPEAADYSPAFVPRSSRNTLTAQSNDGIRAMIAAPAGTRLMPLAPCIGRRRRCHLRVFDAD